MAAPIAIRFTGDTGGLETAIQRASTTVSAGTAKMLDGIKGAAAGMMAADKAAAAAAQSVGQSAVSYDKLAQSAHQYVAAQTLIRQAINETREAEKAGTMDRQAAAAQLLQLRTALSAASAEYRAQANAIQQGAAKVHGSAGMAKFGLQDLGFQLSDVATQFAGGTRAAVIFAQQGPQIVQAVQMMSGGTSKFAQFMAGGWGAGIMVGVAVLGALISKLDLTGGASENAAEALGKVKFASSAMGDAQSILGNVMDITTGKINAQVPALLALARAQLAVARVKAIADEADQRKVITSSAQPGLRFNVATETTGVVREARLRSGLPSTIKQPFSYSTDPNLAALAGDFSTGKVTGDQAVKRLEGLLAKNLITQAKFGELAASYANIGVDRANQKIYADAEGMLDGKSAPYLLKPGKEKAPRHARTSSPHDPLADADQRFAQEQAQLDQQIAQAKRAMLVDVDQIAKFEADAVDAAKRRYDAGIEKEVKDKHITQAQGQQLVAEHDILTGLQKQKIQQDQQSQHIRDAATAQLAANDNTIGLLHDQESLATTTSERRRLALESLALEKESVRIRAQEVLDQAKIGKATAEQAAEAQRALDGLNKAYAVKAQVVEQQTQSPLERYIADNDPKLVREKVETLQVQQLEAVRQGIDDAISSALGIHDPFLKGLIDLFIQTNLINPIAEALQKASATGGGGGFLGSVFGGVGKMIFGGGAGPSAALMPSVESAFAANAAIFAGGGFVSGPGNGTSDSIHARLSNGEFVMTADAVRRIGVSNLDMLNKGSAPRFASGGFVGGMPLPAMARNDNAGMTHMVNIVVSGSASPKDKRETADQAAHAIRRMMNGRR